MPFPVPVPLPLPLALTLPPRLPSWDRVVVGERCSWRSCLPSDDVKRLAEEELLLLDSRDGAERCLSSAAAAVAATAAIGNPEDGNLHHERSQEYG